MHNKDDLELLIKSRIPIVVIETKEEKRAIALLKDLQASLGLITFQWTITEGMSNLAQGLMGQAMHQKPEQLLRHIKSKIDAGLYILIDFHAFMDDPVLLRLLKDIALEHERSPRTLILIGHNIEIPGEIRNYCANFELSLPTYDDLDTMVKQVAITWVEQNSDTKVRVDPTAYTLLLDNLAGLTLAEARRLSRKAIFDDGIISHEDLPAVMQAKYELLNKEGILQLQINTEHFADVGGLQHLKSWLDHRKNAFKAQEPEQESGLDIPKGVLLLGVQGCGKSLAAKAVAGLLGIPLLRLDFGAIYNKFHGETERNIRESLNTAEVLSPCVLWIDEIEKGFSTESSDGGTSKRVLGTLLTWMAEKQSPVFIVATANDVTSLPPELVRKGRFDEIFFVDLPKLATRLLIYKIHLTKRKQDIALFDITKLAQLSAGFSGAEIEQSIVSSLYTARAQSEPLADKHIFHELSVTKPLSVVMAEQISHLRLWAADRTVAAD